MVKPCKIDKTIPNYWVPYSKYCKDYNLANFWGPRSKFEPPPPGGDSHWSHQWSPRRFVGGWRSHDDLQQWNQGHFDVLGRGTKSPAWRTWIWGFAHRVLDLPRPYVHESSFSPVDFPLTNPPISGESTGNVVRCPCFVAPLHKWVWINTYRYHF